MTIVFLSFVAISVVVALWAILTARVGEVIARTSQFFETIARYGYRLRDWKEQLLPLMRFVPFSANSMTLTRGVLLNWLNWSLFQRINQPEALIPGWFIWVFIGGWSLDFFDGLKARWQKKQGRPIGWYHQQAGKYLDPLIDIPTSLATAIVLMPLYHHQGLIHFLLGATVLRFILYGVYRLWAWYAHAPGILPTNIAGQSKTWFLATSFGLLLVSHEQDTVQIAEICLSIGLLLEAFGILSAFRAAIRQLREYRQTKNT